MDGPEAGVAATEQQVAETPEEATAANGSTSNTANMTDETSEPAATPASYNELNEFEQYVLLQKGTERAFTGENTDNKAKGTYICRQCNAALYLSDGHLGHVFLGERFTDKNTRHCVNSVSMIFVAEGEDLPTKIVLED